MDGCQLEDLPEAGEKVDRFELRIVRTAQRVRRVAERIVGLPIVAFDRIAVPTTPVITRPRTRSPPLNLQPGETVRVRSLEQIRATLDANGRCAGLAYVPTMDRYCGQSFPVRKRIHRFFDERTRTMLKVRDVVILDNVFCEAPPTLDVDYGGCHRTCFLFWKEDWLERLGET